MTSIHSSTVQLNIGRERDGAPALDGNIDEVTIWDTSVLTASEIEDLWNLGAPIDPSILTTSANLVSWYRMGDGDTYPTILDHAGSNDATMNNMDSGNFQLNVP